MNLIFNLVFVNSDLFRIYEFKIRLCRSFVSNNVPEIRGSKPPSLFPRISRGRQLKSNKINALFYPVSVRIHFLYLCLYSFSHFIEIHRPFVSDLESVTTSLDEISFFSYKM